MTQDEILHDAQDALNSGNRILARKILAQGIEHDPSAAALWIALVDLVDSSEQARFCLNQVLKLNPEDTAAKRKLMILNRKALFPSSADPEVLKNFFSPAEAAPTPAPESLHGPSIVEGRISPPPRPEPSPAPAASSPAAAAVSSAVAVASSAEPYRRANQQDVWKQPRPKLATNCIIYLLVAICGAVLLVVGGVYIFFYTNAGNILGLVGKMPLYSLTNSPEEAAVLAAIHENIRASNDGDIEGYMATISSTSPYYATMRQTLEALFQNYQLSYKLDEARVGTVNDEKAVVWFQLTTTKIYGPDFRDNRIIGEWYLRKEDGVWKIYDQLIISINYLDN